MLISIGCGTAVALEGFLIVNGDNIAVLRCGDILAVLFEQQVAVACEGIRRNSEAEGILGVLRSLNSIVQSYDSVVQSLIGLFNRCNVSCICLFGSVLCSS